MRFQVLPTLETLLDLTLTFRNAIRHFVGFHGEREARHGLISAAGERWGPQIGLLIGQIFWSVQQLLRWSVCLLAKIRIMLFEVTTFLGLTLNELCPRRYSYGFQGHQAGRLLVQALPLGLCRVFSMIERVGQFSFACWVVPKSHASLPSRRDKKLSVCFEKCKELESEI